jgi:hypothetical protein
VLKTRDSDSGRCRDLISKKLNGLSRMPFAQFSAFDVQRVYILFAAVISSELVAAATAADSVNSFAGNNRDHRERRDGICPPPAEQPICRETE